MDILLVDPPYASLRGIPADCGYNVGLTSLAAYLRGAGMEAGIIMGDLLRDLPSVFDIWSADQSKDDHDVAPRGYEQGQRDYEAIITDESHPVWRKLGDAVKHFKAPVVGISYLTPMKCSVERVARLVKEVNPQAIVVAGGAHPTFQPQQVLANKDIDYVIRGEGEIPLLTLLRQLNAGTGAPKLETVPGLSYRGQSGELRHNALPSLISDLDSLPYPARDLVLNCNYQVYPVHCTSSTRGCPYSCSFCADKKIWGGKVRRRSVENVIQEMTLLQDTYKPKSIDFDDGTFTFDRRYMEAFCTRLIDLKMDVTWRCCARYDNLDESLLSLMRQAGCAGLFFGLESGSDRVLRAIDKKTTTEQIVTVSHMVSVSGIPSITSILMGIPGETKQDMEATLRLMARIKTDFFEINSYTPLPGSRLYDGTTDDKKDSVDWLRVSFSSTDSCFSNSISREDLKEYLHKARKLAEAVRKNSVQRFQAAYAGSE